jgi:hypothetical protein
MIVERYLAVWSEPDPDARRKAVAELWAPRGAEFVEGTRFQGHRELEARIAEAYDQFVATGAYTVTSAGDVTTHADITMFTIQLTEPGAAEPAWAARVFLVLDGDGRIRQDYHLTVKPLPAQ